MNVLLDKNVPYGVRGFLQKHMVETVEDRGWGRVRNGIRIAETAGFDVVVTADQNIIYQQNLKGRMIALIVFGSNIWPIVKSHSAEITAHVEAAKPGTYTFIAMQIPPKPRNSGTTR